jgi:hypothetical protein
MRELCYTDYDVTCTSVGRVLEWCWKSVGVVLKMAVIIMVIMVFLVMFTVVNEGSTCSGGVFRGCFACTYNLCENVASAWIEEGERVRG